MKPKIGVTFSHNLSKMPGQFTLGEKYLNAIIDNGGIPIPIPAIVNLDFVKVYADTIDGLLIPGGEDINPILYGEDVNPNVTYVNMLKDNFEIALIKEVANQNKPIFGICRGMQIVNVAFGGTLIQDIPSKTNSKIGHRQSTDIRTEPTHKVEVLQGSLLNKATGRDMLLVNSYHHQAVDVLADKFIVTAKSADGIIEAIEYAEKNIYCVQWHPEAMYERFSEFAGWFLALCKLSTK